MGFSAGDSNLYRYSKNAPTDHEDPSGDDPPPANGVRPIQPITIDMTNLKKGPQELLWTGETSTQPPQTYSTLAITWESILSGEAADSGFGTACRVAAWGRNRTETAITNFMRVVTLGRGSYADPEPIESYRPNIRSIFGNQAAAQAGFDSGGLFFQLPAELAIATRGQRGMANGLQVPTGGGVGTAPLFPPSLQLAGGGQLAFPVASSGGGTITLPIFGPGLAFSNRSGRGREGRGGNRNSMSRPGQKPCDAPSGTLAIDEHPSTQDIVHRIKANLVEDGVGAASYVGISPDGDVIVTNPNGTAVNLGPWTSYNY